MYNALLPLKAVNWSNVWKLLNLTKKLELLLRRLMSELGTRYCFGPRSWVLREKLEPISLQLSGTLQGMTSPQRGPTSDLSLSQQALISIWWLFKVKFYASTNTLTVTCNDMCMYLSPSAGQKCVNPQTNSLKIRQGTLATCNFHHLPMQKNMIVQ